MKDELVGKIMTELDGLKAKTNSYFIDGNNKDSEDKKQKAQKKCHKKKN